MAINLSSCDQSLQAGELFVKNSTRAARTWTKKRGGAPFALALLASTCLPTIVHAEATNTELQAEIRELRAQIREMRQAITSTRVEGHRTSERVKAVAARQSTFTLPPPTMAVPAGAVPAFVTADKRLQFGSITITPGGFIAAESVFRSRSTIGDATAFSAIPFGNNPLSATNEQRFTARQSRVALLAEAPISSSVQAAGYLEFDFLGAAHTANGVESNSYNPRIRNLYLTLDNNEMGLHVLAGQSWTLATLNSKGITPRNEVAPPTIDPQFVPGFVWARQPQIRVTKDFNRKLWFALSVEGSQTTFNGCAAGVAAAPATAGTVTCQSLPQGGGGFFDTTNYYSLNHVPDIIAKAALEQRVAERDVHMEVFGMYRDLYDTAFVNGGYRTQDRAGYGVGAGLLVPLMPHRLDFQATALYGRGVGRYGTSTLPDASFASPTGAPTPVPEAMFLGGFTAHVTPAIDVYGFGGFEKQFASYISSGGANFGVGSPTADDTGCYTPGAAAGTCAGNTQLVWQITGGMWDKLYKGSFGEVRAGLQYSYTRRQLFASTTVTGGAPAAQDHIVWTSLRYFPFQ